MPTYDAIIIGTGQSGPSLAVQLAKAGRKTAIIERDKFGGTCVNTGCIPTKTLIASARVAYLARRASDFGVEIGAPVKVDMAAVKARKDAVVRASSEGLAKWLRQTPGLSVIEGHARFEEAHSGLRRVTVNGETLEAGQVFINVGARAAVPALPGLEEVSYLTNSSMMDVDFLPRHLIILGGSYIALEFAQMYRRFGSDVTVVEAAPRLIAREDPEVSETIRRVLEREGIEIHVGARAQRVAAIEGGIAMTVEVEGSVREIHGSHLLVAVGRKPNTDDLGLDKAGIRADSRGYIAVDDTLRTSAPGIWALGEVNGHGAFTHTSYNDYQIVAANLLHHETRRLTDRIQAYALYTDPPLGRAGMSEQEARQSDRKVLASRLPMERTHRARARGETEGFMSVLVDAETRRILGATFLGIEADEIIHTVLDLMYADAPYTTAQHAMHIHPTVSEFIPVLFENLQPLQA